MVSINITQEDIDRLSAIELFTYATGEMQANENDQRLFERLNTTPVRVNMTVERGRSICGDDVYRVCKTLEGDYPSFSDLRRISIDRLAERFQGPGFIRLSVLYAGIFVGEPEDVLNQMRKKGTIMYPVKGLGQKIAEVEFVF